jgi:hypothetical protein
MPKITDIDDIKRALTEDRDLRLDFYAAVAKAFRDHGKEIDIDLLLALWLEMNPLAPMAGDQGPWGKP